MGQSNEYKLIKEEQGIQIFAKEMDCHDNLNGIHQRFYNLQLINTTELPVTISWNIDTWYNGTCTTCGKAKTAENTYSVQLEPSASVEGSCDKDAIKGLKVYIKEINLNKSSVLSKFEISNFNVQFNR